MISGMNPLFYVGRKAGHFVLASRFNRDTTSIFLKLARNPFFFFFFATHKRSVSIPHFIFTFLVSFLHRFILYSTVALDVLLY